MDEGAALDRLAEIEARADALAEALAAPESATNRLIHIAAANRNLRENAPKDVPWLIERLRAIEREATPHRIEFDEWLTAEVERRRVVGNQRGITFGDVWEAAIAEREARSGDALADERYKISCPHQHGFDPCLLVEGHRAPHLMLDDDYPRTGPRRREYECTQHPVAAARTAVTAPREGLCATCGRPDYEPHDPNNHMQHRFKPAVAAPQEEQ